MICVVVPIILWFTLGFIFKPLVKDATKLNNNTLLIPLSLLFGIPITFFYLIANPNKYDIDISSESDEIEIENYAKDLTSLDEYLELFNTSKKYFLEETNDLLNKIQSKDDIEGIYLDDENWIIEVINNNLVPKGIVPIGVTLEGDFLCSDFRLHNKPKLVILNCELEPEIFDFKCG